MVTFKVGDLVVPGADLLDGSTGWYRAFNFLGRVDAVIGDEVVVDWFKRPERGPKRGRYLVTSVQHADLVTRIGGLADQ